MDTPENGLEALNQGLTAAAAAQLRRDVDLLDWILVNPGKACKLLAVSAGLADEPPVDPDTERLNKRFGPRPNLPTLRAPLSAPSAVYARLDAARQQDIRRATKRRVPSKLWVTA